MDGRLFFPNVFVPDDSAFYTTSTSFEHFRLGELRAALREDEGPYATKILDRDELASKLQYHRQRGERIVLTNGCFDLLHVGHLQYLQYAASLGDRLVVSVNDDISVGLLKGKIRPMTCQENRARVLAALGAFTMSPYSANKLR
jgi:D-beta-D-heptose 7-phosphate kinase / D-beta-D-heptose 1-phosphate adenosyltransferase